MYEQNNKNNFLRRAFYEFSHNFLFRWLVMTVCIASLMFFWRFLPAIEAFFSSDKIETRTVTPRGNLADEEKSIIQLFEQSKNSVVFITTKSLVRDFWTKNTYSVPQGSGSGFVWSNSGYIVTNYHVIKSASQAKVKLADGRAYNARVVGVSPAHDLAVLKIDVAFQSISPIPIGTSGDLKVGQSVYAIGNPFGLDWTLTGGLVSALNRSLFVQERNPPIDGLIQTDAAINPGNSGGPLLDSAGRLVGVNTAIYSPSGTSAGIGFAVPVDTVMKVVPKLIKEGKYTHAVIDAVFDEGINSRLTSRLGVKGVALIKVYPNTNAFESGLRGISLSRNGEFLVGDIITEVEGRKVESVSQLNRVLEEFETGQVVTLKFKRGGEAYSTKIRLSSSSDIKVEI